MLIQLSLLFLNRLTEQIQDALLDYIQVDGSTSNLDIDFVGGSAPDAANGSGFDIYTFTIQKTAATPAYHIVVNALGAN